MHRTSPTTKNHQTESVSSAKVETPPFIHSFKNFMRHGVPACARHCARFWEPRNEGYNPCLPELPSTNKDNREFLKGQYNVTRTALELITGEYVKWQAMPRLVQMVKGSLLKESTFHQHAVGNGYWQGLLVSDFLGSNPNFTTPTSCAFGQLQNFTVPQFSHL